jgi:hypothetical protein
MCKRCPGLFNCQPHVCRRHMAATLDECMSYDAPPVQPAAFANRRTPARPGQPPVTRPGQTRGAA